MQIPVNSCRWTIIFPFSYFSHFRYVALPNLCGQRIRMENVINWSSTQSVDYLYIKMVMMATSLRHKRSWKGSGKVAKWGSWLCSDLSAVPLNIGFQPAFPHAPPPPPPPPPPPLLNTGMHSPGSRVDQAGCNPEAAQIVQTWSKHGPTSLLPPHGFTVVDAYERGVTILFWLPPTRVLRIVLVEAF